jgi:hypothetical protein
MNEATVSVGHRSVKEETSNEQRTTSNNGTSQFHPIRSVDPPSPSWGGLTEIKHSFSLPLARRSAGAFEKLSLFAAS